MNKEIKFRIWDNVDYMSNPFTLKDLQEGKVQFSDEYIIMQYTGIKDKSDKEIYEDDVVLHAGYLCKVIRGIDKACFSLMSFKDFSIDLEVIAKASSIHIEIVGNIHTDKKTIW